VKNDGERLDEKQRRKGQMGANGRKGEEVRKREAERVRNRSGYSVACGCTRTFNGREQNTRSGVTERRRGMAEYTAEGFSLQDVSREVKGGGAVRYAMCEITIAHP
jgi:hypothetical protein